MNCNSVTFRATSNDVKSSEIKSLRKPIDDAIKQHKAYAASFKSDSKSSNTGKKCLGGIIQYSSQNAKVVPVSSGFVSTVLEAYNRHHDLILRADDVWQAILTQLSFYINARAEALRDKIVDFEGKKQLTVSTVGTLFTVDFGKLANCMVTEISKNIKDPKMTEWLLPSFTTTTTDDKVAASVTIMATLQKYFDYKFGLACGIPSVTLLGSTEDWIKLRQKLDGLLEFELDGQTYMKQWHTWLVDIADNLVESSKGNASLDFWDRVASHHGGGSGPSFISGWITAFTVWSDSGEWQAENRVRRRSRVVIEDDPDQPTKLEYPMIDTDDLACGVVSVPVLVDDNGTEYDCFMLAGQFGMYVKDKSVGPSTDWCIVAKPDNI